MKEGINTKISLRYLRKKILICLFRLNEIFKDIFNIELGLIFRVLYSRMSTFPNSVVFSGDEEVSFLLIVEKEVNQIGLLYFSVLTVGIELYVIGEGFDIGIITT